MKGAELRAEQLSQLGSLLAGTIGLHFPPERWNDLRRGMAGAAGEFGFEDVGRCADWLLSGPRSAARLRVLAAHLTIGETYFFRDPQTFKALAGTVLPEMISARRDAQQRRLRIWSAACSSGEEPYSLAILLHETVPDLDHWDVTITATDINPRALEKAATGSYGEWSFRDAPAGLKERYFTRTPDGRYVVVPHIRERVTFACLNLVDDAYPALAGGGDGMDLVFCRNVLMYFTPRQAGKVIVHLRRTLAEGGWLVVSPSEASHALFPDFAMHNFPGAILYRKDPSAPRVQQHSPPPAAPAGSLAPAIEATPAPASPAIPVAPVRAEPAPALTAELLYQQGRYAEAAESLMGSFAQQPPGPKAFCLLARSLANLGQRADALVWCERWIAADKLDCTAHYLRAVILLELGDAERARTCLQRAVYLDPDFVLAHFALGNLERSRGHSGAADKHFANALDLLQRHPPDALLPESEGLSVRRLTQTIASMLSMAVAP